jgi:hypothetical protein
LPRRRKRTSTRLALPASELEAKIMELIQNGKARGKIKDVEFVYVGSFGSEPNWFARALPVRISDACKKEFVSALAQVRKDHDLLFDSNGAATSEPAVGSLTTAQEKSSSSGKSLPKDSP